MAEIEQVLAGDPVFRADRRGTGDFLAEGVTDGGRRLRVVVAYHSTRRVLRPIAAWGDEMSEQKEPTTEAQRAEDHYAHRDDDDRWGDPVGAQGPDPLR